jgi:hypothetical protein
MVAVPKLRVLVIVASAGLLAGGLVPAVSGSTAGAAPFNVKHLNKIQRRLISGELVAALAGSTNTPNTVPGSGDPDQGQGADGAPNTPPEGFASTSGANGLPTTFVPTGTGECTQHHGSNVKVNQNCLNVSDPDLQGRGQANNETFIAQDPSDADHLVASDNDYVRGDGTCGASYSLDRGRSWNDSTVPNIFTRGGPFGGAARQYWQAGGDTSVAFDTRGDAYLSCQAFNRGTAASSDPEESSGFFIYRSTGNAGASWNFPGRATTTFFQPAGGPVLEDKQLMAVDASVRSPFRDRVYVTWTEFAADGTAYIYESHSSDYGETFSPRVLVSKDSALCPTSFGVPTPNGRCNENQYSDPFTGPDGALYVAFANFNNGTASAADNHNQMLLVKSTDGGASFGSPVKISDYYDLPECDTYQGDGADPGRSCVPEKGSSTKSVFRATNYPAGAVNPGNAHQVIVTFGSYINRHSNEANGCIPAGVAPDSGVDLYTGVKTRGACNNDIVLSVSGNGGATFSGTNTDVRDETSVTQDRGQATTDQWFQWAAFTNRGTLAVDYYDRQYGSDETSGYSDFSLSGSDDLRHFASDRVTSSSMPPPTQFGGPNGGQFWGDYTGLAASDQAYPIWSDTRAVDLFTCPGTATGPGNPPKLCTGTEPNGLQANDEEMYADSMRVPLPGHHH